MAEVRKFGREWFEGQSREMRSAMSCRGALRVLANIGQEEGTKFEELALTSFRCVLISAGRGLGRPADVDWRGSVANYADSAANYAAYLAGTAADSSHSAALSAADSARSSHSAVHAAGAVATRSAGPSAYSAALSADSTHPPMDMLSLPLWPEGVVPDVFRDAHSKVLDILGGDEDWAFFRRWYLAMWNGGFEDWDLMLEVARIPDEVWDAGLSKVAEAIRGIEEGRAKSDAEIEPEPVPVSNVLELFDRAPIVQASMASMSEAITLRLDAFSSVARPNEPIAFVDTLRNMPDTAQRICDILARGPSAPNAETALALEVGRLRAEVERLKADLKGAHDDLDALRKKPWFHKTWILSAGAVLSSIGVALWTLSDNDFDGEARWNNLAQELAFFWSKLKHDEDEPLMDQLRFALPDIEAN